MVLWGHQDRVLPTTSLFLGSWSPLQHSGRRGKSPEKQSSWGRFPKFPLQIQGLRFLPWTECRKLVPSSLFWKREDMESKWKMELSPKEPSLWLGMIPGKNMRRGGRSILEGKANLCFIQTSPGPKGPGEANRNSEKQSHLKHGGNPWSPCPWSVSYTHLTLPTKA